MKYQGIVTGNMDWVQTSPLFSTKTEAEAWVSETVKYNNAPGGANSWTNDSGYVVEVDDDVTHLVGHNED